MGGVSTFFLPKAQNVDDCLIKTKYASMAKIKIEMINNVKGIFFSNFEGIMNLVLSNLDSVFC